MFNLSEYYNYFTTIVIFLPLVCSFFVGVLSRQLSTRFVHGVAVLVMTIVTLLSLLVWYLQHTAYSPVDTTLYIWGRFKVVNFEIGFLVDRLSSSMMVVVSFVSLMVHVYTIGYMRGDPGYNKFFSYILFFTFSMLLLVASNNVFQLFVGWEAVGLASYLLIGFWYKKCSAVLANFKAFVVNRVGDLGLLLGLVALIIYTGESKFTRIFEVIPAVYYKNPFINIFMGIDVHVFTLSCFCLFVGAMGKSAQIPLHVWLPDSMEGPTPISALIHAATMVTAGIFMVSRFSPLFEYASSFVMNFIMLTGSITCLLMGFLGVVQNDIKRIIAYSTLSQLGLMVAGLGASSYSLSMLHLINHAFFKALLFLGAGSVIVALHHEQNILKMGYLRLRMPVTYITMLIGSFSLAGFPGLSGFFSKDLLIDCVKNSTLDLAYTCYVLVLSSVFFTALYSFRLIFIVFHKTTFTKKYDLSTVKESSYVILVPLILLAFFSVFSGWFFTNSVVSNYFYRDIFVLPEHGGIVVVAAHYTGVFSLFLHGFSTLPFLFAILGLIIAWFFYVQKPELVLFVTEKFSILHTVLLNAYGFDLFNKFVIVGVVKGVGLFCYRFIDKIVIDGFIVHGIAKLLTLSSLGIRKIQTGYLYHYVSFLIIGLLLLVLTLFGIVSAGF